MRSAKDQGTGLYLEIEVNRVFTNQTENAKQKRNLNESNSDC